MTLALLLRYWREAAIGALLVVAVTLFVQRDHRLEAKGAAVEKARVADSTLAVVAPERVKAETTLVEHTKTVTRLLARIDTVRDTVLKHLTDTVLVKEFVTRADSAAQACTELAGDCAKFRAYATQEIAAWKAKANVAPVVLAKSCTAPTIIGTVLGGVVGYLAHR